MPLPERLLALAALVCRLALRGTALDVALLAGLAALAFVLADAGLRRGFANLGGLLVVASVGCALAGWWRLAYGSDQREKRDG